MANRIYQYSLLSALMYGLAKDGTQLDSVLRHGDHGLGTVTGLDGEVIIVDSTAYHFPSQGPLRVLAPTDVLPYVLVTRFQPTLTKELPTLSKSSLADALSPLLPAAQNSFVSVRIQATFVRLSFRMIPKQSTPREPLSALARRQEIQSCANLSATVFGFYSPGYSTGFSVAGFHLHFLSADRRAGGHIIDFDATGVCLDAAQITDYHVELPVSGEFQEVAIGNVVEHDLHAAEGG